MLRLIVFHDLVMMKTSRSLSGTPMLPLSSSRLQLVATVPPPPPVNERPVSAHVFVGVSTVGKTGFDVKQPMA